MVLIGRACLVNIGVLVDPTLAPFASGSFLLVPPMILRTLSPLAERGLCAPLKPQALLWPRGGMHVRPIQAVTSNIERPPSNFWSRGLAPAPCQGIPSALLMGLGAER